MSSTHCQFLPYAFSALAVIIILAFMGALGIGPATSILRRIGPGYKIVEWEHGLKTSRVIATRYENPHMGWNIGFTFPKNRADGDRAELSDFFEAHNGWIYQGGGYPGAGAFVKFKDVTDKDSANKKMREILPELSQVITDLGEGRHVTIANAPPKRQWPDTTPPPEGLSTESMYLNGTPYKKAEVQPGKWQWVVDRRAQDYLIGRELERKKLFTALKSRVLTDAEMKEVINYGSSLNTPTNQPYYAEEKSRELANALQMQQLLLLRSRAQTHSDGAMNP